MKNKFLIKAAIFSLFALGIVLVASKYFSVKEQENESEAWMSFHQSTQKKWRNKELKIPDSLYEIKTNVVFQDFVEKSNNNYLIVSFLNADCSDCVYELNKWKEYLSTENVYNNAKTVFIATSSNKELFKHQVIDQAKFPYPIFFDSKNEFIKMNDVSDRKLYQTFLLKNNNIVYVGSPITDDFFKKELKSILTRSLTSKSK